MADATPSSGAGPDGDNDVFLSYHSADAATVRPIADYLRQQGLKPFLDRWFLSPGQPWVPALERALARCRTVAVFIGPHGLGSWQQREKDFALNRQGREPGFPVIPVLLPGADPALGFFGQNTWVDLRADPGDAFGLRLLICGIRRQPPGPDLVERLEATRASVCPYRGLLYFREEDAPFFFGREVAVDDLVRTVAGRNFLAVVGASGSGKSSVVRAGLVPALRRARDPVWEIATLVPGDEPFKALARALAPLLFPELDVIDRVEKANKLSARFAEGAVSLRDLVEEVLKLQPGTQRLLLVVDQWEELYTLTTAPDLRRRFVDELLDASACSPLTVALTLRGDFVGHALAHRPLADRLQGAQVNLGPMTRAELQRVIEEPARKVGLGFEPGLVQRLLDDVGEEPGNLPLLEFVLRQLWEECRGTALSNRTYDELGRLSSAIAQRAERFYQALAPAEQEVLRRLFLQLVHVSVDGQVTRRRERLDAVPAAARPLVERLANRGRPEHGREPERLLVTVRDSADGGVTVEVAHEALLRSWQRLESWLRADREFLLWRERFRVLLESYRADNPETLLRGPPLDEAERRLAERAADLTESEREFIAASLEGRRRRAEEEGRQRRRLQTLAVAATVLALLATMAGLVAWRFRTHSERNRLAAEARLSDVNWQLAQQARGSPFALAEVSPLKATHHLLQAALAARDAGNPAGAANALLSAHFSDRGLVATLLHSGAVVGATNSPDHRFILTWSKDCTARLWRATDGQPVGSPMRHQREVQGAMFSPDGQRILTWSGNQFEPDGEVRLWQAVDGRPVGDPMRHQGSVNGALFSADGQRILSWSGSRFGVVGEVRLWRAADSQPMGSVMKHEGKVNGALFSADGQRILSWGRSLTKRFGEVRLWQTEDGSPIGMPMRHKSEVLGAVYSPDGQRILSWSADRTARLWSATDGRPLCEAVQHEGWVEGAVFSPDGRLVLSWSGDSLLDKGEARLWRVADAQGVGLPMLHQGAVKGATFTPDGHQILSWSADGTARLWQTTDGQPVGVPMKHEGSVNGAVFSADGQRILSWSGSLFGGAGEVRLWRATDGQPAGAPMRHERAVNGAVFSPDGRHILSWSADGTARVWQTVDGLPVGAPLEHGDWVNGAAFSFAGRHILSWSDDGTARLWRIAQDQPIFSPIRLGSSIRGVVFSSDRKKILSWHADNTLRMWQVVDGRPASVSMEHGGWVKGALFSPDGRRILSWSDDGLARLWDASDGRLVGEPMQHARKVLGAAFSPDGQRVLSWSAIHDAEGSEVRSWQAADGRPVGAPMKLESPIGGVAFSPDGQRILGWDSTGTVWLRQAADGQPMGTPLKHGSWVNGAMFSPAGQWILSWNSSPVAGESEIRLWQAADGQPVGAPMKHERSIRGVVFSPDGQRILSWDLEGTARIWRATDGRLIGTPMKHGGEVWGATFSPNRQRILSWSADGTVRLWNAGNSQLMAMFQHQHSLISACFDLQEQHILTASGDGAVALWDISFDPAIPVEERLVEFEVRSATTLEANGEVRVLTEAEWAERKARLAELRHQRGVQ